MYIFSFDCAIKNLGFCCLEIDDNWRNSVSSIITNINELYEQVYDDKTTLLNAIHTIVSNANNVVDQQVKIVYMNVFDLMPGENAKTCKYAEIIKRLKYVIYSLEKQLPNPDVVLIEYQMNINDKARGVSRYIEEYFTPIGIDCTTNTNLNKSNNTANTQQPNNTANTQQPNNTANINEIKYGVKYALPHFPLKFAELPKDQLICKVHIISPSLKNFYNIDHSSIGDYCTFQEKYASLYSANKAHTVHHFKYFLKTFNKLHLIEGVNNKLDDLADAFMMAYAWCKKQKII